MTWVKPSFLWMMYRSGWATKPGQERVLAVTLTRQGLDSALGEAALSTHDPGVHATREAWRLALDTSTVRVQWDPERDLSLQPLPYRCLQLGLAGPAVERYVDVWTVGVRDVTDEARAIHALVEAGDADAAGERLPVERAYPVAPETRRRLGMPSRA